MSVYNLLSVIIKENSYGSSVCCFYNLTHIYVECEVPWQPYSVRISPGSGYQVLKLVLFYVEKFVVENAAYVIGTCRKN